MHPNNFFKNIAKNKYFQLLPNMKEERLQKFTTLVLTLIALSFFGIFAISPTLSTIAGLRKELDDNQFVDKQLQQKIANLTSLQQKYAGLKNDLPTILASFPNTPDIPLLAAQVQAVAGGSVIIQSFQTFEVEIPKKKVQKYLSYSFTLTAEGSYSDLSKFLSSLSNMQRVVTLDILSLTKKSAGDSLVLTLKGKAYFLP